MSWYYRMAGSVQGPIEREGLTDLLRVGTLTPQVEVSEDQVNWLIAPQVPGLMSEVLGQPQASPTAPTPAAVTPATNPAQPNPVASSTPSTQVPGPAQAPATLDQVSTSSTQIPNSPSQASAPPISAPSNVPNTSLPSSQPPTAQAPISNPPAQTPTPPTDTPSSAPNTSLPNSQPTSPTDAANPKADIPSLPIAALLKAGPPEQETPAVAQTSLDEPENTPTESPSPTEAAEEQPPSGPVAHIVLDPVARAKRSKKRQSSGVTKLVIFGVLGLAAMLVAGFFTATKVFGMDFRPARVDTSVSKFMIESPELVASIDPDTILTSKAYRKALLSAPQLADHPFMAYVKDVKSVTVAMDKVISAKHYVAILDLKRDYRTEFVANLCREGTSETVGDFEMHTTITSDGGSISVTLPQPRTLLIGSSYAIKTLLERNAHPKLYPRESELIASALENNKGIKVQMHFDSVKSAVNRLQRETKAKMAEYDDEQRAAIAEMMGNFEKSFDNLSYAADNIKHATFEVNFADKLNISAVAECGSNKKATKIASIYDELVNSFPVPGQSEAADAKPFAEGSKIIAKTVIDPTEVSSAIGLAVLQPEF